MDICIVSHGFRGAVNPQKSNLKVSICSPFSRVKVIGSSYQILKGKVEGIQALSWVRMSEVLFVALSGDLS